MVGASAGLGVGAVIDEPRPSEAFYRALGEVLSSPDTTALLMALLMTPGPRAINHLRKVGAVFDQIMQQQHSEGEQDAA
jgi:hypothetical protein